MAMQVRATQLGYHALRRRKPGEIFMIEDREFSKKWMEKVGETEQKAPAVEATASVDPPPPAADPAADPAPVAGKSKPKPKPKPQE